MRFDSKSDFALLLSCWGFSFALGHGVYFFGGIQHSPVNGCSTASCNFGVLAGEDELTHERLSESHSVMPNSVHGILQARILEWVAFPFFKGSSQTRD